MIWRILLVLWQYRELIGKIKAIFNRLRGKPKVYDTSLPNSEKFRQYRDDFKGTNQNYPYPPMSDNDR